MFVLAQFHDVEMAAANELILGFGTKNIAEQVVRVEQAGGRVLEPVRDVPGMGEMQIAFVADPEGHVIQLTQVGQS